jgi:malate dehydrogenase (quinone)
MSATVGLMLQELEPNWKIMMFERLHAAAEESSNGFNNAGTGHAGFMEPNYTKEVNNPDGSLKTVTVDKVTSICSQFMQSRQYWEYLVKKGHLPDPDTWIHQTNHIALGIGKDQCEFIAKRYAAMKDNPLFSSMEYAGPMIKKNKPSGLLSFVKDVTRTNRLPCQRCQWAPMSTTER